MRYVIALALLCLASSLRGQTCGVKCGVERWSVKTFTDRDSGLVNTTPVEITVRQLRQRHRPANPPVTRRVKPTEVTTFRVQALLIGWKQEKNDEDFHLVIADTAHPRETMIAEVPSEHCRRVCASGHLHDFEAARQAVLDALGAPSPTYRKLPQPRPVTVTGVGFYDFPHGQIGRAPNTIELHPVLKIEFK